MATCDTEIYGSTPANIVWNIVRGDTATLRVDFLEDDEVTAVDIDDWEFTASAYDFKADVTDELEVEIFTGYVIITATSDITENWGLGYRKKIAELAFDLQVTIDDVVWTPVLGTISIAGDVTGGTL
jgi:hypothetical protein